MNALQPRNVDDLLRSYFRAEMPEPWPALQAPASVLPMASRRASKAWWAHAGRLAIAASVAFLLIGYLALASLFPPETSKGLNLQGSEIGQKPGADMGADSLQKKAGGLQGPALKIPPGFQNMREDHNPNDPKTVFFYGEFTKDPKQK